MPNSDYWKKRMAAVEESQYKKTREYYQYAQEQFRKTEASINREIELWYAKFADNNEISLSAAKELLRKDELEEFHWSVEEYIKKGESLDYSDQWREALNNASAKVHINRLEAIKLQMQQECEVLYGNLNDNVDAMLRDIYTEGYYRTAYEIQKGTGVGYAFNRLDTRRVGTAVNSAWAQDGRNFSDRLWRNKENLVNSLNETLTQNIIRGENPRRAIDELSKKLGTSKTNAGRLYMTESAAISARSQKDCYKELEVEEFEFVATIDTSTCDICGSMDGRHFPMSEYEIGLTVPPLHPNCRCVTAPYFPDDEEDGTRAARNEEGKTYEVPANMTYKQWKEKYVKDIAKTSDSGIIKSNIEIPDLMFSTKSDSKITLKQKFNDTMTVSSAYMKIPTKVKQSLNNVTIELGYDGSACDIKNKVIRVGINTSEEEIYHEYGHLIEHYMMNSKDVQKYKEYLVDGLSYSDIKKQTYYDTSGNSYDIYVLNGSRFESEYQSRLYIADISQALNGDGTVNTNVMGEIISEPFKKYMSGEKVSGEIRKLLEKVIL
jgi:SPP1 gp7 family putative phage head morphogenesis protein